MSANAFRAKAVFPTQISKYVASEEPFFQKGVKSGKLVTYNATDQLYATPAVNYTGETRFVVTGLDNTYIDAESLRIVYTISCNATDGGTYASRADYTDTTQSTEFQTINGAEAIKADLKGIALTPSAFAPFHTVTLNHNNSQQSIRYPWLIDAVRRIKENSASDDALTSEEYAKLDVAAVTKVLAGKDSNGDATGGFVSGSAIIDNSEAWNSRRFKKIGTTAAPDSGSKFERSVPLSRIFPHLEHVGLMKGNFEITLSQDPNQAFPLIVSDEANQLSLIKYRIHKMQLQYKVLDFDDAGRKAVMDFQKAELAGKEAEYAFMQYSPYELGNLSAVGSSQTVTVNQVPVASQQTMHVVAIPRAKEANLIKGQSPFTFTNLGLTSANIDVGGTRVPYNVDRFQFKESETDFGFSLPYQAFKSSMAEQAKNKMLGTDISKDDFSQFRTLYTFNYSGSEAAESLYTLNDSDMEGIGSLELIPSSNRASGNDPFNDADQLLAVMLSPTILKQNTAKGLARQFPAIRGSKGM